MSEEQESSSSVSDRAINECGSCGAPTEFYFIAPGDRAMRCPYCGRITDLEDPDPPPQQAQAIEQARQSNDFSYVSADGQQVAQYSGQDLPPQAAGLLDGVMPNLPGNVRTLINAAGVGLAIHQGIRQMRGRDNGRVHRQTARRQRQLEREARAEARREEAARVRGNSGKARSKAAAQSAGGGFFGSLFGFGGNARSSGNNFPRTRARTAARKSTSRRKPTVRKPQRSVRKSSIFGGSSRKKSSFGGGRKKSSFGGGRKSFGGGGKKGGWGKK